MADRVKAEKKWCCVPKEIQNVGNGTCNLVVEFRGPTDRVVTREFNLHAEAYKDADAVEMFLKSEVKALNEFEDSSAKFAKLVGLEITE